MDKGPPQHYSCGSPFSRAESLVVEAHILGLLLDPLEEEKAKKKKSLLKGSLTSIFAMLSLSVNCLVTLILTLMLPF